MTPSPIPLLRNHMENGKDKNQAFRVKAGAYTYYVRVIPEKNMHHDVLEYIMDVGGRKRGCVTLRIPTLTSAYPGHTDAKTALLKHVKHNPLCSVNTDRSFISGFGTKHMLKTALYLATHILPNTDVQHFRFMDISRKDCDDGTTIDLPYFMIAMYGKTYYEKYFHANLVNPTDIQRYQQCLKKLKLVPRDTVSFADLITISGMSKDQSDALRNLYQSADTFTMFFQSIRNHYPDQTCKLVQVWLVRFITGWLFSGDDLTSRFWVIPTNKLAAIHILEWEIMKVDIVDFGFIDKEQHGGSETHYLGVWDPKDE